WDSSFDANGQPSRSSFPTEPPYNARRHPARCPFDGSRRRQSMGLAGVPEDMLTVTRWKRVLCLALMVLVWRAGDQQASRAWAVEPAELPAEALAPCEEIGRSAAVALNYCRASFHRIRKYPSKRVL